MIDPYFFFPYKTCSIGLTTRRETSAQCLNFFKLYFISCSDPVGTAIVFVKIFIIFIISCSDCPSEQVLFSSRFLLLAVPTVRRNRYCFRQDFYCFYYYSLFLPKSHSVCTRFCGSLIS